MRPRDETQLIAPDWETTSLRDHIRPIPTWALFKPGKTSQSPAVAAERIVAAAKDLPQT